MTFNAALAYRVLDHLVAHPDQFAYDMEIAWVDPDENVTEPHLGRMVGNFAGWTCVLAGRNPVDLTDPDLAADTAVKLLGFDNDEDEYPLLVWPQIDTVVQLQQAVPEVFGPRPGGAR